VLRRISVTLALFRASKKVRHKYCFGPAGFVVRCEVVRNSCLGLGPVGVARQRVLVSCCVGTGMARDVADYDEVFQL
jgi:hypothetical protein